MQNKEQLIEMQTIFSRRHIGLLVVLLLFLANNFIFNNKEMQIGYLPSLVLSGILIVDIILGYNNFFHKFPVLVIIRIVEVVASGILVNDLSDRAMSNLNNIVVVLFFILFVTEIMLVFDVAEMRNAIWMSILCQFPFLIDALIIVIIHDEGYSTRGVDYLSIAVISFMVTFAIATYYGKTHKYFEQSMFSKDRLLDRAKDNSDKITESQKSLRDINEQLGIKKFELEEAYRKINNANSDIEFQNYFMKMMMSTLRLSKVVSDARDVLTERFSLSFSELIYIDPNIRSKYQSVSLEEFLGEEDAEQFYEFFMSSLFIQEYSTAGSHFILNQVDYDEFPFFQKAGVQSVAINIMVMDDVENLALYVMLSPRKKTFVDKDMLFSNMFGQMEVVAKTLALYHEVRQMSIKDPLTGLYNRRYLNVYFNDNFIKPETDKKVSAVMIDIDHFKSINDTYGHLFGDLAIKTVAEQIGNSAREYGGEAFRYGGEEFVIIFENRTLTETADIMEKLRINIKNTPVKNDDYNINVNVSIGVTAYPEISMDIRTLIDRADKAMYYSKQHGRDQITVDNGSD